MDKYKEHAESRCRCVLEKYDGDIKAAIYELMERRAILENRLSNPICDKQRVFDFTELSHINKLINDYSNYTNPLYMHNNTTNTPNKKLWEYLTVPCPMSSTSTFFDGFGNDGWELVTIQNDVAVFKRQKQ